MITLVLGGARSGKSLVAERLVDRRGEHVTYVATARTSDDADLAARVAAHQRRRPPHWTTVEYDDDLVGVLERVKGSVLIDSLGTWLASRDFSDVDIDALCAVLTARVDDTIIVSDEVGLGVHPATQLGREFRDALGELNQAVASVADHVFFVIAGRVLPLQGDDR